MPRRDQTRTASREAFGWCVAVLFGAVDQYLGTGDWPLSHGSGWLESVSVLAAPWMALPFIFGARAGAPRAGAQRGLLATLLGLAGYFAMTWSPIEHARFTPHLILTQVHVLVPALITGPLFGWLGWRWTARGAVSSAVLLVAAFVCEAPILRLLGGRGVDVHGFALGFGSAPPTSVWIGETVIGVILAVALALSRPTGRERGRAAV